MSAFYNIRPRLANSQATCLPPADILVWDALTVNAKHGIPFSWETIVAEHIIVICSRQFKVAVEFDTPSESRWSVDDRSRIEALTARGFAIVTVRSCDVYENLPRVVERILNAANRNQEMNVKAAMMRIAV